MRGGCKKQETVKLDDVVDGHFIEQHVTSIATTFWSPCSMFWNINAPFFLNLYF
jgi:hypothetical protein